MKKFLKRGGGRTISTLSKKQEVYVNMVNKKQEANNKVKKKNKPSVELNTKYQK